MKIDNNDALQLANYFKEFLVNVEYADVHLTYQLATMSRVVINDDGTSVQINAPTYDVGQYREKGVIIHDNKGSYASANDTEGGFSGEHKDYIQRAIEYSIEKFLKSKGIDISEVEIRWN